MYARLEALGLAARIAAVNGRFSCPAADGPQLPTSATLSSAHASWLAAAAAEVALGPTEGASSSVNFSFAVQYFGGGRGAERRLSDLVVPLLTRLHWAASEADLTAEVNRAYTPSTTDFN